MGQYGYLACTTPNRTRQAILVVAYIMMAVLAVSAAFAVAGEDQPQSQSWAAAEQPEVVKFTSFRTGREVVVPLVSPAESDLQTLTHADFTAGLRALHRGGLYHTTTLVQITKRAGGYGTFPAILDELSTILRKHGPWTAEEIKMLKAVLAEQYPHIVIH